MRIGVVGLNGRMSQAIIEEVRNNKNYILAGALVRNIFPHKNIELFENIEDLAKHCDAIIDFSNPTTSVEIAKKLANHKVTLVCGTTGFNHKEFEEFKSAAKSLTIIYSANMSIGINLLQILLQICCNKLGNDFESAITDIHHKHKKDSPSGTALMLAKTIEELGLNSPQIASLRLGEVPGEHSVIFSSAGEAITLSHQAFNRRIFAQGALRACSWSRMKKPGFYSMQDVLND